MQAPIDVSLHAMNAKSLLALLIIGILPLLVVLGLMIWMNDGRPMKGVMLSVTITALLIAGLGTWQLASVRMQLDETSLTVGGGFYRVSVPLDRLVGGGEKIERVSKYGLGMRTNGIGMPGLSLGWFNIQRGGKAFVAITDPDKVVRIPTQDGYTILVSPEDPDDVVRSLRRR